MFKKTKILLLAVIILGSLTVEAQQTYQIKTHDITIDGTSNLQSWSADIEKASGTIEVVIEDGKITSVKNANIRIDATSIKGSEGRMMNSKINETLDTRNNPNINFVLREVLTLAENPGTARMTTRGVMTIAGVSRVVELNTVGRVLPNGDLEFSGTQKINMTDYRMKPPTAMFGALRTGEEVEISYKVVVSPR